MCQQLARLEVLDLELLEGWQLVLSACCKSNRTVACCCMCMASCIVKGRLWVAHISLLEATHT